MLSQLGFVAREFWPGDYGLGDCDEFGGVPYQAPHRSPLPNLSGRSVTLTPEEILLAAEEGETFEDDGFDTCEADLFEALPAVPADLDPMDAFPRVLKPALLESTSGLLPRKLSRDASRSHHRSWKRASRRRAQCRPRILAA